MRYTINYYQDEIKNMNEEKLDLEEEIAKLRKSTKFRVEISLAQGIDLPGKMGF